MRVAVDAVGGDYAPAEVVRGAVQAARNMGVEIILVGPEERLRTELASRGAADLSLDIHHTDQFGVKGVMVVGHGRSRASGVEKAIGQAKRAVESHLIETIEEELAKL